jgi:hypothetical protein
LLNKSGQYFHRSYNRRVFGVDNDVGPTNSDAEIEAPAVARTPMTSDKTAKKDHFLESGPPMMSWSTSTSASTCTFARDGVQWLSPSIVVAGNLAALAMLLEDEGSISDEDCPEVQTRRRQAILNCELGLDLLTLHPGGAGDFDEANEEEEDHL